MKPKGTFQEERAEKCSVAVKHMLFDDTGPLNLASGKHYLPF